MGKNTLHMIGLDARRGAIVLREKVSRRRISSRLANLPPVSIRLGSAAANPLSRSRNQRADEDG